MPIRRRVLYQRGRKPPYGALVDFADPITAQLKAAFMLGEGAGARAYNAARLPITAGGPSGLLNTATSAWTSGHGGPAWSGNGSSRFIDIGMTAKPAALNLTGPVTLLALVNPSTISGAGCIAVDCNGGATLHQWGLYLSGGKLVQIWANSNFTGTATLSANKWTSVGCTRSGSAGSWNWATWINGQQDAASGTPSPINLSVQQGAAIGQSGNDGAAFWSGLIEYIYIWVRTLGSGEISRVANDPYCFFAWPRRAYQQASASPPGDYSPTGITGGSVQASGLVGLTAPFVVQRSVIHSVTW